MRATVRRAARLTGASTVPGDKSISHRSLLFGALSEGVCEVRHLGPGADVRSTARCLQALGVELTLDGTRAAVRGRGLGSLCPPSSALDCGNSGTTMRLLSGVVAGAGLPAMLDGDESLRRRPMRRVLEPLRQMGARAAGTHRGKDETAPLTIEASGGLKGVRHDLAVASAQVKSCCLLAGLFAEGETWVREPERSRDHTERMLAAYGAPLERRADRWLSIRRPSSPLRPPPVLEVPGDPSSAAFLFGAAALLAGSELEVGGIDVNPTRAGFLAVLRRMGAAIEQEPQGERAGDPVAMLRLRRSGALRATNILPGEIPSLVDEVPLLSVVATQAQGTTTIHGASELRVKESDRLAQVAQGLTAMGARIDELPDGLIIHGPTRLHGAELAAHGDHRLAMAFTVAGLVASGETQVDGAEWADVSFPGFFALLAQLTGGAVTVDAGERGR